ncbi:calcium-activated potassium channel slowpoke-like isoform X3 [Lineus longissimus]|uniref:calcium-activated potassium channel slowpoke-like isoform X3 n=1 Tax=Lineus longissimus TaxID=88925 RepID=UPI00315DB664
MNTSEAPVTTPSPVNPCSLDPKWWYFLISSGCSLLGGIVFILILRGIKLLITKIICPNTNEDGERTDEVNTAVMFYLRLKRRCEELVASQNALGKLLTGLHVICSIGSFIIYIIDADDEDNLESCIHWIDDPMQIVDSAFNLYFLLHFVIRFIGNRDKLLAWVSILSLIDHFTVPPMIVAMVIQRNWLGLRFLRAFGLIGLSNMLQAWNIIRSKTSIRLAQLLSLFMAIWLAGAGVMHLFETTGDFWVEEVEKRSISNNPYMLWCYFLIVTMSTVGYGDYAPATTLGRIFTIIFIMTALGFFASCIPEIVEGISDKKGMIWKGSYKRQYGEKTVVVCGHLTKETVKTFLKDFLHKDRVVDKHLKVIFLGCDQPDLEMEALLKHYMLSVIYFQGTVMNINDLERIRIKEAIACLILSNKHCTDPEQEDASAIMKVIALKDYDPEVRVVVQLLNYQNKGHLLTIPNWSPSRGDKVVCLSELKLGFMAQSCIAPGFSTLLANLFTLTSYKEKQIEEDDDIEMKRPNAKQLLFRHKRTLTWQEHYKRSAAFEMYTSRFSQSFHGLTFKQAAELCYRSLDLLLMAIDVPPDEFGNRSVVINPTNEYFIDQDTDGFFVAQDETEVRRVRFYCTRCHKDTAKIKFRPCKCVKTGMHEPKNKSEQLRTSGLLYDVEKGKGVQSNVFYDINDDTEVHMGDLNKNTNESFMPGLGEANERALTASNDSINDDKLDTTGLFYWCQDHDMDDVVMTYQQAASKHFSNHVVLCLFAESDSPLIGLCSFIMPLRASNLRAIDIKPILIIGNLDYLKREWTNIMNFPQVYILSTNYVPSLTKTIHIGNSQGSPLSRAYLRAANIFECSMCVVLTARKNMTEMSLADKEAILCTLNIKTMPKDIMAGRSVHGVDDAPGERILTITELANDYNVQYLEQDDDTDDVEIFMAQPYACGKVFTSTLLDSLMSTTYHNQNALAFIRALVTGGVTTQVEQIYAEGFGLIAGDRVNPQGRNRTRVSQVDFEDERFVQFQNGCTFEELWLYAIRKFGIILIGLYRLLYPSQPNAFKRFVITLPAKEMSILPSDKFFLLEPFVPTRKMSSNVEVEEQNTVL